MAEALVHDAAKGFHDIKAIPDFYARPLGPTSVAISALLLAVAILYWIVRRRRQEPLPEPAPNPFELQLRELDRLAAEPCSGEDEFRERCASASLCFRYGLEALLDLPAADRTADELAREFAALRSSLSSARLHRPLQQAVQLVHSLERCTYAAHIPADFQSVAKEKLALAAAVLREIESRQRPDLDEEVRDAL